LHSTPIDYLSQLTHLRDSIITWNKRDFVPPVKMSAFLIGLQNRFGLWYDFDFKRKVCTIRYRNAIFSGRKKRDATAKAGAKYNFKNNSANTLYALTQTAGSPKPDFKTLSYQGVVINPFQFPPAVPERLNHLYFVLGDNSYWYCTNAEGLEAWVKIADNNFDYDPGKDEKKETITTQCLIPGHQFLPNVNMGGNTEVARYSAYPSASIDQYEEETFYICYHHGMGMTINYLDLPDYHFPQSTAACHDLRGTVLRHKALVWEYNDNNNFERGLYKQSWAYFLSLLFQREEITLPVKFTLEDVLNMSYTDTLVIKNVEYFIKNPRFTLPLREYSNMELIRIH
ncbi:MAG: hypothetical protein ACTHMC_25205, partial [Pseudobacter sp.]|uniref:hypothetical protein n=1 Tax=Pseudobacter sp. TaxID=2045420 RepID=UPI003F7D7728